MGGFNYVLLRKFLIETHIFNLIKNREKLNIKFVCRDMDEFESIFELQKSMYPIEVIGRNRGFNETAPRLHTVCKTK